MIKGYMATITINGQYITQLKDYGIFPQSPSKYWHWDYRDRQYLDYCEKSKDIK